MLNRRIFIATGTAAVLTPSLFLTGCDTTTVAEFVSLIGTDGAELANLLGDAAAAQQITNAAALIAADLQNWKPGDATQSAIQAIQDLIALIQKLVPAGSNPIYVAAAVLLLGALTGLLALLPSSAASSVVAHVVKDTNVQPTHYDGFDKKSMTKAKKDLTASWAGLHLK
jgi:hypothetical protein